MPIESLFMNTLYPEVAQAEEIGWVVVVNSSYFTDKNPGKTFVCVAVSPDFRWVIEIKQVGWAATSSELKGIACCADGFNTSEQLTSCDINVLLEWFSQTVKKLTKGCS